MGGRRWSAARGSAPPSLSARVLGRGAQPSRPPGRRAPAPSRGCPLGPAAPGSPAAPRLRPADPRALRPEGTRGGGPGAGFLGSHFCAAARLGPLLPPAADPPRRESWRLGGRARHRQPLPGVGTTTHVFLSGASRTATRCRCAWQPSRVRGPRAGMPGSRAAAARGPRGEGCLAPSYPEEAAPARGGPRGHRTDTCLQGSAPARARRSEWVRLLRAGWAVAPRLTRGSSSCSSSSSPAKPGHRRSVIPAPVPSGGRPGLWKARGVPSAIARVGMGLDARPRRAVCSWPTSVSLAASPGFIPRSSCRLGTRSFPRPPASQSWRLPGS